MKNSLKRTTLLVTLALMSSALARPVISMTAIPPSTASCHATGKKAAPTGRAFLSRKAALPWIGPIGEQIQASSPYRYFTNF